MPEDAGLSKHVSREWVEHEDLVGIYGRLVYGVRFSVAAYIGSKAPVDCRRKLLVRRRREGLWQARIERPPLCMPVPEAARIAAHHRLGVRSPQARARY